jgi:mono/diheme cytochrome c family protein
MMARRTSSNLARRVAPAGVGLLMLVSTATWAQERTQQPSGTGTRPAIQTHDDLQPAQLPPLPKGMTIQTIVQGDSVYHGKGNCSACHGVEGEGLPAAGDALTVALNWAQYDWRSIDSLINHGIPQVLTRSPIQMPPRGGKSNLSDEEVQRVAAYIWAISQTRGEPWPGGHTSHSGMVVAGIDKGTATRALVRSRPPGERKPPR